MLPVFAFANKLVYMFLSGCAAPEPWAVPQPVPCYPLGTLVLSLLCCRAHFSASLATRMFCVGAKQRASDKCQKKSAAEPAAVPAELGWSRSRILSVAWSLIAVLWPGLWGASSLDLGLGLFFIFFWGGGGVGRGWLVCFFFFLSPSPSSVGKEEEMPTPPPTPAV